MAKKKQSFGGGGGGGGGGGKDLTARVNARRAAGRDTRGQGAAAVRTNPFERIKARRRHDVLGARLKGAERKLGQSRSRAVENRRATLLRDFLDDGKVNAFRDKRIGENDDALDEDDRMLLRFQRERGASSAKAKSLKGGRFALADGAAALGGEEHLGDAPRAAEDSGDELLEDALRRTAQGVSAMRPPRADDLDEGLDEEDTARHFTGGADADGAGRGGGADHKSREEIMAEVIAKSKAAKAERAREREEREAVTAHLDSQFEDIMDLVARRPTKGGARAGHAGDEDGADSGRGRRRRGGSESESESESESGAGAGEGGGKGKKKGLAGLDGDAAALLAAIRSENDDGKAAGDARGSAAVSATGGGDYDDYDAAVRSLTFERRVRATDRTKTEEEIAKETAEKLQIEEARRLRRMKGEFESDDEIADLPAGGFAKRRVRRKDYERTAEALNTGESEAARERRLAKSAPVRPGGNFGPEDGEDGGAAADDASSASSSGSGSGSGSDSDSDSDADSDPDSDDDDGDLSTDESESDSGIEGIEPEEDPEEARRKVAERKLKRQVREKLMREAQEQLPFTFDVPADYDAWTVLVHGRPLDEVRTIVDRMAACHHVSLDPRNRARLGKMVSHLLEHVVELCAFDEGADLDETRKEANFIADALRRVAPQCPEASTKVFRARLIQLSRRLRATLSTGTNSGWPDSRALLTLRMITRLFPMSDAVHPVGTACTVLMAHYMAQCRVTSMTHAAAGLSVARSCLDAIGDSSRLVPEAVLFLEKVLRGLVDSEDGSVPARIARPPSSGAAQEKKSSKSKKGKGKDKRKGKKRKGRGGDDSDSDGDSDGDSDSDGDKPAALPPIRLSRLGRAVSGSRFGTADDAVAIVATACDLAQRYATIYKGLASFPELFRAHAAILERIADTWANTVAGPHARTAADAVKKLRSRAVKAREPASKNRKAAPSIETLAPAFSERFNPNADPDPDRSRAERKRLRREVAKETKAAARELRKDNFFLEAERQRRVAVEDAEYRDKIKSIMSTLETQQHDMKLEKHLKRKEQLKRKDAARGGGRR